MTIFPGSASASRIPATFHSWMQMQNAGWLALLSIVFIGCRLVPRPCVHIRTALWLSLWMDRDMRMEAVHVVPKLMTWTCQVDPTTRAHGAWGEEYWQSDSCWDGIGFGYGGKSPKPPDDTIKYQGRTVKGFWHDLYTNAQAMVFRWHSSGYRPMRDCHVVELFWVREMLYTWKL